MYATSYFMTIGRFAHYWIAERERREKDAKNNDVNLSMMIAWDPNVFNGYEGRRRL